MLGEKNWDFTSDSVQAYWNEFENQLISIIDGLAPLIEVFNCLNNKIEPNWLNLSYESFKIKCKCHALTYARPSLPVTKIPIQPP